MSRKLKTALAKKIIRVTDENIDDEELIHALLEQEIYVNTENEQLTVGEKAADFLRLLLYLNKRAREKITGSFVIFGNMG